MAPLISVTFKVAGKRGRPLSLGNSFFICDKFYLFTVVALRVGLIMPSLFFFRGKFLTNRLLRRLLKF